MAITFDLLTASIMELFCGIAIIWKIFLAVSLRIRALKELSIDGNIVDIGNGFKEIAGTFRMER